MDIQKISKHYDDLIKGGCKDYRLLLILLRFIIRDTICLYNRQAEESRYYSRQKKILEHKKIIFVLLDVKLEQLKIMQDALRSYLAGLGDISILLLDRWEEAGGNFEGLCDLIGTPRSVVESRLCGSSSSEQLSKIMTSCGLDYQDNGSGWYEFTQDGPFTHATREHLIDVMLHTEKGKIASHQAFKEVFPEIMEKALHLEVDEEGEAGLYNNAGEFVTEWRNPK